MRVLGKKSTILTSFGVMILFVIAFFVYRSMPHVQRVRFYSASLHKQMMVDVYLPPGYSQSRKYPVLYVLHGKDGNQTSWMTSVTGLNSIHIDKDATRLIRSGKIAPLIIVSPEIDNGYGIDTSTSTSSVNGYSRGQYADFITRDLVQYIQGRYSTIDSRDGRYIGGYSMGGFAALHAAFTNQNMYSKVGVMSAALWNGALPSSLSWIYPTKADQKLRDPITIARDIPIHVPVFIIEGKSDPFYTADLTLAQVLQAHSAAVTLKVYPGGHNYTFWEDHATELLKFFASKP